MVLTMSYPLSHTVVNKKKKKKRTIEIIFRGQSRTVSNINIRTHYHTVVNLLWNDPVSWMNFWTCKKISVFFSSLRISLPRSLFVLLYFFFWHCVVSPSSIYGFWLPLWYLLIDEGGISYWKHNDQKKKNKRTNNDLQKHYTEY